MKTLKSKMISYTPEEARQKLYSHLHNLCDYWSKQSGRTEKERMEGLCFSILVTFDGGTADLPAIDIRMSPHKDDKKYLISLGEKYFEPQMLINNCQMHEEFVKLIK